jgi:sialate O-acetylesterase
VQVGSLTIQERPDAWCFLRSYPVPGTLVKSGRHTIAVRVHSDRYAGGMTGPAAVMQLSCPGLRGAEPIPLAGTWRYAVETSYGQVEIPPMPPGPGDPNSPCALFDGMIAPLLPLPIRGALWYQGESNAGRPRQYRDLFPALIRDWRRHWQQGDFPFLFVQLPNYGGAAAEPGPSAWAELREAQALALRLPGTGMAVTIDVGEAADIHPPHKQVVGLRLALNALATVYGRDEVVPSGPVLRRAWRENGAFLLEFEHVDGGLECRGEELQGFAVAGNDRRFVWAQARIEGEAVRVWAPAVADPQSVRYAWADNPLCNLYNRAGLPAAPFRTDDWS